MELVFVGGYIVLECQNLERMDDVTAILNAGGCGLGWRSVAVCEGQAVML